MRHDCLVIQPGKELIISDEVLHLRSSYLDVVNSNQDMKKLRSLRSMLIFANHYRGNIRQISNYVYLRVLYLDHVDSTLFPELICKLKHLRYLKISGSKIEFLPESIIYLQNLQVLVLQSCRKIRKLPEGMRYMKNLQRLDISCCNELQYMPIGMKKLTSFRRLSNFVVGKKNGALIGELGDLNLLGWEFELSRLENVGGLEDATSAYLKYKRNMLNLRLCWSGNNYARENKQERSAHDEEVLEGLEPSASLKELIIKNYVGKISPSWMVNLENLVAIEFFGCENYEHIPQLGELPSLKKISLCNMNSLKCFHDDITTALRNKKMFPALQELYIHMNSNLVSLPNNLPKLESLKIVSCKRIVSLPSTLPNLEVLYLLYCAELVSLPSSLPKLTKFRIACCQNLTSLPNKMQNSNELNELWIFGCENLSNRCEKETAEDWPKISHIPNISIDGYTI